ncbi:receptor-type tyrosine-protein phosphatase H-like [Xiphias gladius]|uniref:receptor-type tyrosine-protein phosphatase H-like n=1 Tax=Xiphias gladius TaxID=8245 RepID=UPI001A9871CE|nr:receptor-type tyrosine-protein phosphatase H-like [Xiphias gladius]
MMKPLSFKITSDRLPLCVFLSLLWGVTDSNTSSAPNTTLTATVTNATEAETTTTVLTTPMTSPSTTKLPPRNAEDFKSVGQSETSITLQWKKVNGILNYTLVYSEGEINVTASAEHEQVTHTISDLTSGTKYGFSLFTVFENVRSSGINVTAFTAPENVWDVKVLTQFESSITLKWNKVNNISTYILQYHVSGSTIEKKINASHQEASVTHVVASLTAGTKYNFNLITVFEGLNSTGYTFEAVTAPRNAEDFKSVGQSETSITLQWKKVNGILNYTLVYGEGEINVTASAEHEQVTHTISDLTSGTKYDFSLFTVFEYVRSSGVNVTAVTAPRNAEGFKSVGQSETSITLQWKKVNGILNYTLVYSEGEINVTASAEHEQVTHTISDLTSGTKYSFSLFTVFENVRSSGVNVTAFTALENVWYVKVLTQFESSITLKWDKVNNISTYILQYHVSGSTIEKKINASHQEASVTHVVASLTAGTKYNFNLITVFEGLNSTGYTFEAVTAPRNAEDFKSVGQSGTSITLQWKKVNGILNYTLVYSEGEINVTASAEHEQVTHTISDLTSGTKYDFSLFTVFEYVRSSGVNVTAVTAPRNAEGFKSVGQSETSITLQWKKVNGILNYTLVYSEGEINVTASAEHEQVTHTISDLTSGTKYGFSLFTVFENVRSSGVNVTAFTAPENVESVTVLSQNVSSITLMWNKVNNFSTYILQYDNNNSPITGKNNASHQEASVTHVVHSLTAGTKYNFSLITVYGGLNSTGYTFEAVTVPPTVSSVNVTERSATSITLKWYNVDKDWSYLLQIDGITVTVTTDVFPNVVSHSVTSLRPGREYRYSVITVFSGLNSTAYESFTVTAIDCTSVAWHVTNSSIQGMVEGLFSNATATNKETHVSPGGSNVSFTGLYPGATYEVSLVYERHSTRFEQCRQNLTILPPNLIAHCEYREAGYSIFIAWNKPDGVWTAVEVNVTGKTHHVTEKGKQHTEISGFLPAKTYEVSVTSLSGTLRSYEPFVFLCSTDPRGVIAGSVLAGLLFGALVCLAVFVLFIRPDLIRKKPFIHGSKLYNERSKSVSLAKFPDHFSELSVDDNRGFSQEYEHLAPIGTEQTRKAALLPENKAKNRFNNVLPYDWCRVKLNTSNLNGTSDYINASYMPGYNSNREYIATQGPLPSTVNDFWRMIWEQRVKGIVMVTNCTEGGRIKCERYWPADSRPCHYGELLVTIRSDQNEPNWNLRKFSVKHKNTSEERTVKHFHFTAWPDHGVPQSTEVLIQFRGMVRWHIEREGAGAPTVVHCSAGVGRTGTIIALDVLLQQLDKKRAVGINAFVHKMRLSRPYMVQTESQYVFLHQCIMDCLQPREKTEESIYENGDVIYANATALQEFR